LINNLSEINLDYAKKIGAILILRNTQKYKPQDLLRFKSKCDSRKLDLFIANDVKTLFLLKSNKFYISSYNKSQYWDLSKKNKKLTIVGSAHSVSEINEKLRQGCKQIFLSRLFKTKYKNKKGYLGTTKFNLLSRSFATQFVALGGINEGNFNQTKRLNSVGLALSSDKKKAGKYIPAFFKKVFKP